MRYVMDLIIKILFMTCLADSFYITTNYVSYLTPLVQFSFDVLLINLELSHHRLNQVFSKWASMIPACERSHL